MSFRLLFIPKFKSALLNSVKGGYISRVNKYYSILSEMKVKIYHLSYGNEIERRYTKLIDVRQIIPVGKYVSSKYRRLEQIKSFFLPIILRNVINNIDIVKTHQLHGSWVGALIKLLYRKKLVIRGGYEWLKFHVFQHKYSKREKSIRYWLKYLWIYIVEFFSYKLADLIILTNKMDIKYIIETYNLKKEINKIHLNYNWINTGSFKPLDTKKKKKHVLFIGKLSSQKNLRNLIKAFKELNDFSLHIIGDGGLKKDLKDLAEKCNCNVKFLGIFPNNELPNIINTYEIFILPSFYEGNPKVLLEAMSCGMPCIGSDVWGINNIIKHKENGYLCDTDPKSIRKAIIEVHNDEVLKERIGKNARKFILNNCSARINIRKEFALYQSLLE